MTVFQLTATGLTTFDFLGGYVLIKDGWTIGESLTESWEFVGRGSAGSLRTELATLNALLQNAREWRDDPLRANPTWLEFQSDGEGEVRRRLILDGGREFLNRTGIDPLATNQLIALTVDLEFAYPWWEEQTETTVFNEAVSCNGGTLTIPGGGDMDGRISRLILSDLVAASTLTQFWIGTRQAYDGSSDLVATWFASLGLGGIDATTTADADCVSGTRVTISFGTTTALDLRRRIVYGDIVGAGSTTHLRGRYLVLLRYKLPTSASAVALELRYGYDIDTLAIQDAVIITTSGSGMSNYGVIELGMVQFPPNIPRGTITDLQKCVIDLYAERITGSTSLYLAELILIPADHLIRITGANVGVSGGAYTAIHTHEDEEVVSTGQVSGDYPSASARPEPENWRLPYQPDSILVLVGARSATNLAEADEINLALYAHYCWQNYST